MRVLAFVFALAVRPLEGPFLIGIVQSVFIIFARGSFFPLVSYFLYLSLFFLYICVGVQRLAMLTAARKHVQKRILTKSRGSGDNFMLPKGQIPWMGPPLLKAMGSEV